MQIFNYNQTTKEFIGMSTADKSPLENDVYLIPANATTIKPPQIDANQVAVFENNQWVVKADYRGKTGWNTDTKQAMIITEIGDLPANFSETELKKSAEELKNENNVKIQAQIQEIDLKRIRALAEGGTNPDTGKAYLDEYTAQIQSLREQLTK